MTETRRPGRPATGRTPVRSVRISDAVWDNAVARAATEGRTITAVIDAYLRRYGGAKNAPSPAEPEGP